ncbi:type III secretion protein [Pseudomonas paralactis]|uniref:Type III secretion protein n=1 Tax=Pseudomonas paralactis TaxID=1615673 RepID=A0ABS0UZM9_9PSED|nr:type III secretion protein [Pseudomonas paralactis]MBI6633493.1 type III secretion protein [Pseudomonas paralactis]
MSTVTSGSIYSQAMANTSNPFTKFNGGTGEGFAGGGESGAEGIFEKMKADAIKNGWKSAEVKNIQGLIRSGAGQ